MKSHHTENVPGSRCVLDPQNPKASEFLRFNERFPRPSYVVSRVSAYLVLSEAL